MTDSVPPLENLANSIKELTDVAKSFDHAALALSRPVAAVNHQLRSMNLAVPAWERIHGNDDDGYGNYWSHDVGYARRGRSWGICIRTTSGNHNSEGGDLEEWVFDEAPVNLRIDSVEKIPALISKLIKAASKTTKKLREKAIEAELLAKTVVEATTEVKQTAREERQRKLRERQP